MGSTLYSVCRSGMKHGSGAQHHADLSTKQAEEQQDHQASNAHRDDESR